MVRRLKACHRSDEWRQTGPRPLYSQKHKMKAKCIYIKVWTQKSRLLWNHFWPIIKFVALGLRIPAPKIVLEMNWSIKRWTWTVSAYLRPDLIFSNINWLMTKQEELFTPNYHRQNYCIWPSMCYRFFSSLSSLKSYHIGSFSW